MNWKEKYINQVVNMDCLDAMKEMPDNSIDCIVTDPPYQLCNPQMGFHRGKQGSVFTRTGKGGFMGKEWDVIPSLDIWKECLRVLKPGAFAFIMCTPRQDSLCLMISRLAEAGFQTGFTSIYWTYASGFPKASNISLLIDKQKCTKILKDKLGRKPTKEEFEKEWKEFRKVIKPKPYTNDRSMKANNFSGGDYERIQCYETEPATEQAKTLDGSYGGFQPKPAIEIILVVMKPLSEKTYVEQAMKNGKGITWFDDGRIPHDEPEKTTNREQRKEGKVFTPDNCGFNAEENHIASADSRGRFPANILVSDDVLDKQDDGTKPHPIKSNIDKYEGYGTITQKHGEIVNYGDAGSFSRYFSLDTWFKEKLKDLSPAVQKVFPFLIVPKANKGEKNEGLYEQPDKNVMIGNSQIYERSGSRKPPKSDYKVRKNIHPTCKPIKLMSYLVTIGSREKDIILDPFAGSCTTGVACIGLNRQFIMCEKEKEYFEIGKARLEYIANQLKLF